MKINKILHNFAKIIPKKVRTKVKNLCEYAGVKYSSDNIIGIIEIVSLSIIILSIIPFFILKEKRLLISSLTFLAISIVHISSIIFLLYLVKRRNRQIEEDLPDLFQLLSSNLKAGMTPFKAFGQAVKRGKGPLYDELKVVEQFGFSNLSFEEIIEMTYSRIRSKTYRRVMRLFMTAHRSGSPMSKIIDVIIDDLIDLRSLRREMVTSTKTYFLFISFIVIVGAPLLLAISINFIDVMTKVQAFIPEEGASNNFGISMIGSNINISSSFVHNLSLILILVTSLLSAILLGVIKEGDYTTGLIYAPFFMAISVFMLYIFKSGIHMFVGI